VTWSARRCGAHADLELDSLSESWVERMGLDRRGDGVVVFGEGVEESVPLGVDLNPWVGRKGIAQD